MQDQPDNQPSQQDQLESQLRETITAEKFFEQGTGQLWTRVVQEEITLAVKDITSDKYEKDHMGYLKRLSDLQAYQKILRKMQAAASPLRKAKINEKLEAIESDG